VTPSADDVVRMVDVSLRIGGVPILGEISWTAAHGETWVILGPNGSGKTSALKIASLVHGPTTGTLAVLGETYGRCDVREVRRRIGFVSAATLDRMRPGLPTSDVVMTAKFGALEPWWNPYEDRDRDRARSLLDFVGCGRLADRAIGLCSQGERQRVMVARALMADPDLLVLDEPCAGLDLGGREALLAVIDELAADGAGPAVLMSTHHLEEIPRAASHALVLRDGRVLASGPIAEVLDSTLVSEAFDVEVTVEAVDGRWASRARPTPR
jgi:iron complex transport system ATP-binding protein